MSGKFELLIVKEHVGQFGPNRLEKNEKQQVCSEMPK